VTRPAIILWAGVAVFLALWCANLDYRKLIRTDEGRYAEIAREMTVTGDWVTPRANGLKYFEKPPLQYWATAAAFEVFGLHAWTARLWTAATGLFGILFTWAAARRLWDRASGLAAAAILAGSLEWAALGHFATLDMSLAAFLASAIAAFCVAQRAADAGVRRRWLLAAWVLVALAVLSKGIVALALPAATLVLYMLWQRDWGLLRRLALLPGLVVLAAITVPWFVAVSQANPEFLQFFFIHEHLQRYLTDVAGRDAPAWYFVPVLAAGLLPWTLALPQALGRALRRDEDGRREDVAAPSRSDAAPARPFNTERFLLVWSAATFVFFSASHSKLESYILPLYPALAMLLARTLLAASNRLLRWVAGSVIVAGVLIACVAPFALRAPGNGLPLDLRLHYVPWLVGAGVVLAATALGAAALSRALHGALSARLGAIALLAAGGLGAAQLALAGHESLSPVYSSYHIAREAQPYLDDNTPFYAVDTYDQTLPFYTRHTMTMVAYRDEFAPGIAAEPQKFIPTIAQFEAAWRASPRAVAFMKPQLYETLEREGLPMKLIARDTRRALVAKP